MLNVNNKRIVLILVLVATLVLNLCAPVFAVERETITFDFTINAAKASNRFNITLAAGQLGTSSTRFPLEKGDSVYINASYSPDNVTVNFGLIGPDNQFHYIPISDGSINTSIEVSQHGYYTLAIENTSSKSITVNGYVNY